MSSNAPCMSSNTPCMSFKASAASRSATACFEEKSIFSSKPLLPRELGEARPLALTKIWFFVQSGEAASVSQSATACFEDFFFLKAGQVRDTTVCFDEKSFLFVKGAQASSALPGGTACFDGKTLCPQSCAGFVNLSQGYRLLAEKNVFFPQSCPGPV